MNLTVENAFPVIEREILTKIQSSKEPSIEEIQGYVRDALKTHQYIDNVYDCPKKKKVKEIASLPDGTTKEIEVDKFVYPTKTFEQLLLATHQTGRGIIGAIEQFAFDLLDKYRDSTRGKRMSSIKINENYNDAIGFIQNMFPTLDKGRLATSIRSIAHLFEDMKTLKENGKLRSYDYTYVLYSNTKGNLKSTTMQGFKNYVESLGFITDYSSWSNGEIKDEYSRNDFVFIDDTPKNDLRYVESVLKSLSCSEYVQQGKYMRGRKYKNRAIKMVCSNYEMPTNISNRCRYIYFGEDYDFRNGDTEGCNQYLSVLNKYEFGSDIDDSVVYDKDTFLRLAGRVREFSKEETSLTKFQIKLAEILKSFYSDHLNCMSIAVLTKSKNMNEYGYSLTDDELEQCVKSLLYRGYAKLVSKQSHSFRYYTFDFYKLVEEYDSLFVESDNAEDDDEDLILSNYKSLKDFHDFLESFKEQEPLPPTGTDDDNGIELKSVDAEEMGKVNIEGGKVHTGIIREEDLAYSLPRLREEGVTMMTCGQSIEPNIQSYARGRDKDGSRSKYMLFECDKISLDEQESVIKHLPKEISDSLYSVVYSGNKSYHCLVKVPETYTTKNEEDNREFKSLHTYINDKYWQGKADSQTADIGHLTRCPGMINDKTNKSAQLMFLNKDAKTLDLNSIGFVEYYKRVQKDLKWKQGAYEQRQEFKSKSKCESKSTFEQFLENCYNKTHNANIPKILNPVLIGNGESYSVIMSLTEYARIYGDVEQGRFYYDAIRKMHPTCVPKTFDKFISGWRG